MRSSSESVGEPDVREAPAFDKEAFSALPVNVRCPRVVTVAEVVSTNRPPLIVRRSSEMLTVARALLIVRRGPERWIDTALSVAFVRAWFLRYLLM